MRIAFVGKGGSGETTAASLFSRHLAATVPTCWPSTRTSTHDQDLVARPRFPAARPRSRGRGAAALRRVHRGGVQYLVTGEFEQGDIGVSCYHAKTGAVSPRGQVLNQSPELRDC